MSRSHFLRARNVHPDRTQWKHQRSRPRRGIIFVVMAMFATLLFVAGSPAPDAEAQDDCVTYQAGASGLLVYAEGPDPSSWSVDTSPAPWLLASLGFSGSGASGGLSYNNDYLYASPGTAVTICIVDQIATILTSQGSNNAQSTWSNVIYDEFGDTQSSLQNCIDTIGYLGWGLSWPFCFNFYQGAYVSTSSDGYDITSGNTGSTAASEDEDPNDIIGVETFADCFLWGSMASDAYDAWQLAYDTLQFELANADFEDDPFEFYQAENAAYEFYLERLTQVFESMPASLQISTSDSQIAYQRVMFYFLATGDEAAVPLLDALSEMIDLGTDVLEFPDGLTPGAVAMSTWLVEACELLDVLDDVDLFIANPPQSTDPPLDETAVSDLEVTIADCAALTTTISGALDALEVTAGQIDDQLALDPVDQDAATLAGLLATYETQSGEVTAALIALVDSLNFLTTSLEAIKDVIGQYLHFGSDLYEPRDADDPLFVVDETLVLAVVGAVEVPHGALEEGLTTIDEVIAAIPEELPDQIDWAAGLCDLASHFNEALSFVNGLPGPNADVAEVWVPLACGEDGFTTGLVAEDPQDTVDAVRGELKTDQGSVETTKGEEAHSDISRIDPSKLETARADSPRIEASSPPPSPEPEEAPGEADSCSPLKKLVQVDFVGTQYENLTVAYGWKSYDPAFDHGPGFEPPQYTDASGTYWDTGELTSEYSSAIVVQVLNDSLFVGRWDAAFVASADEAAIRARLDELVEIGAVRFLSLNGFINIPEADFFDYLRVRFDDAITGAGIGGVTASEMVDALSTSYAGPRFEFLDAVGVDDDEIVYQLRDVDDLVLRPESRFLSHFNDPLIMSMPPQQEPHFLTVASIEANGARWAHQFAIAGRQYDVINDEIWAIYSPHAVYDPVEARHLFGVSYPICEARRAAIDGLIEFERGWWVEMQQALYAVGGNRTTEYTTGSVADCGNSILELGASFSVTPYNWDPFDWIEHPELSSTVIASILED